jgi:hypothetical protein
LRAQDRGLDLRSSGKDGRILTYGNLAADPNRLNGLNDCLDNSDQGKEFQKVSSRQLADFLWQLQHWS